MLYVYIQFVHPHIRRFFETPSNMRAIKVYMRVRVARRVRKKEQKIATHNLFQQMQLITNALTINQAIINGTGCASFVYTQNARCAKLVPYKSHTAYRMVNKTHNAYMRTFINVEAYCYTSYISGSALRYINVRTPIYTL